MRSIGVFHELGLISPVQGRTNAVKGSNRVALLPPGDGHVSPKGRGSQATTSNLILPSGGALSSRAQQMETKCRPPLPTQAHQCGSSVLRRGGHDPPFLCFGGRVFNHAWGPPQVPLYASATFPVKAGISSGCAHQPPFWSDSNTPVWVRGALSGDPRRGGKTLQEGAREEARARPLRHPLPTLAAALRHGSLPVREAHPRSSGEGPWSTSAGLRPSRRPGATAFLETLIAGLGSSRRPASWPVRPFVLGHGLRGERDSTAIPPPARPRPLTDGATVLSSRFHGAGTPLGAAPICRRTA
ncbi:hypothetical protein NDU88_004282 [Pleurodeles waltl]|uniref:Uncharacterized protein n=1 Tax=Pleurodeles waltl TaxID=8319 RepID=A0AAV7W9X2_PLEWA|nr:hypothetical protein NDU88_004282 [Pleurodeles waltl]